MNVSAMDLLANCRLCNYQSDKRFMLNVFEPASDYATKIESYLDLKVNFEMKFQLFIKLRNF